MEPVGTARDLFVLAWMSDPDAMQSATRPASASVKKTGVFQCSQLNGSATMPESLRAAGSAPSSSRRVAMDGVFRAYGPVERRLPAQRFVR